MTTTLTRMLTATDCHRDRYTLCAGTEITVHQFDGPRWAVALDGRVYRAAASDVREATR